LVARAKDSLLSLPSGTIETYVELKEKFRQQFFLVTKFMEKCVEITHFEQGDAEPLCDA